jgi:hypothetical protein
MKLSAFVPSLTVGDPVGAANLTMHPLLTGHDSPAGYATLDEALAAGFVDITEVSEAGQVPVLMFLNNGTVPVLVIDGEELVGAKQNRIVNLTILVPAKTRLRVPVTCVEAGRWSLRSRAFSAAGRAHYASARAMKMEQVSCCLRSTGERFADQGAIWDDIGAKSARMGAHSATQAAAALNERARRDLDRFHAGLEPLPNQVGAMFEIDGAIVGLELFDSASTWRQSMRKIVESYGLDALDRGQGRRAWTHADPAKFLASLGETEVERFRAIGLGSDLRLEAPHVAGAALAVDDRLVHVLAFAR